MNGDIIVPIFLFGGTAAILWKFFDGRSKERMSMIEKGLTPADFKSDIPSNPSLQRSRKFEVGLAVCFCRHRIVRRQRPPERLALS